MYKGTVRGGAPALLRSYDSRKEPAPEYDCTIWEAGRATCAIGLAFKPVKIGQTVFHDDGSGTFNPSPVALDEATVNEWPGRDVGVFISIGTGKRPKGTEQNQHLWYEGFMGEWGEARRKLISKVEGCEKIHERMKNELLMKRGVNIENYYRFNVEVGVGEFAMNEWDRLGDISTGTKRYLSRDAEQKMVQESSTKLAKIHKAKQRYERLGRIPNIVSQPTMGSISAPLAVELPGDFPTSFPVRSSPSGRQSYESGIDNLDHLSLGPANPPSPRSSDDRFRPATSHSSPPQITIRPQKAPSPPASLSAIRPPPDDEPDRLVVTAPTPAQYRNAAGSDKIAIMGADEYPRRQRDPIAQPMIKPFQPHRIEPPPLPPKTPLPEKQISGSRRPTRTKSPLPPYPDEDGPPPVVNMARKPDYRGR